MELLTILLSALLGILSPVGLVVDRVAEDAIRDQLDEAEQLAVRIDNAPSYQLLQGRVDRVRIAGRGIYPVEGVRIAVVEVETDPIAVSPRRLRKGRLKLDQPLRAGMRLVITEDDINHALRSKKIRDQFRDLSLGLLGGAAADRAARYDLVNPQVNFLEHNRIRIRATLKQRRSDEETQITAEAGLDVRSGKQIQLVDPQVTVNDQPVPAQLIDLLSNSVNGYLNLDNLKSSGITARILDWQLTPDDASLALFVQLDRRFTDRRRDRS